MAIKHLSHPCHADGVSLILPEGFVLSRSNVTHLQVRGLK